MKPAASGRFVLIASVFFVFAIFGVAVYWLSPFSKIASVEQRLAIGDTGKRVSRVSHRFSTSVPDDTYRNPNQYGVASEKELCRLLYFRKKADEDLVEQLEASGPFFDAAAPTKAAILLKTRIAYDVAEILDEMGVDYDYGLLPGELPWFKDAIDEDEILGLKKQSAALDSFFNSPAIAKAASVASAMSSIDECGRHGIQNGGAAERRTGSLLRSGAKLAVKDHEAKAGVLHVERRVTSRRHTHRHADLGRSYRNSEKRLTDSILSELCHIANLVGTLKPMYKTMEKPHAADMLKTLSRDVTDILSELGVVHGSLHRYLWKKPPRLFPGVLEQKQIDAAEMFLYESGVAPLLSAIVAVGQCDGAKAEKALRLALEAAEKKSGGFAVKPAPSQPVPTNSKENQGTAGGAGFAITGDPFVLFAVEKWFGIRHAERRSVRDKHSRAPVDVARFLAPGRSYRDKAKYGNGSLEELCRLARYAEKLDRDFLEGWKKPGKEVLDFLHEAPAIRRRLEHDIVDLLDERDYKYAPFDNGRRIDILSIPLVKAVGDLSRQFDNNCSVFKESGFRKKLSTNLASIEAQHAKGKTKAFPITKNPAGLA